MGSREASSADPDTVAQGKAVDSLAALDTQVVAACSQADTPSAAADMDMPLVAADSLEAGSLGAGAVHLSQVALRAGRSGPGSWLSEICSTLPH